MSRGGRRGGRVHLPVESCHSLASWGAFQEAQMWESDETFEIEWEFSGERCELRFVRDGKPFNQSIWLTWAPCYFGGRRCWFLCPGCGRRVGRVYLPCTMYLMGSDYRERVHAFSCRSCYSLTYLQRQNRDAYWTLNYRAGRLERYFAYDEDERMFYPLKWQRRKTFNKRVDEYERIIERANVFGLRGMERLLKRLG